MTHLDGNGAAGVLSEIFAVDMTAAACRCAACGLVSAVGGLTLYGGDVGCVLRCPGCAELVLCAVRTPRGFSLEVRGVVHVRDA